MKSAYRSSLAGTVIDSYFCISTTHSFVSLSLSLSRKLLEIPVNRTPFPCKIKVAGKGEGAETRFSKISSRLLPAAPLASIIH
jgi:hypothetical protein